MEWIRPAHEEPCKDISGTGAKINLRALTRRNPQLKTEDTAMLSFSIQNVFF